MTAAFVAGGRSWRIIGYSVSDKTKIVEERICVGDRELDRVMRRFEKSTEIDRITVKGLG